MGSDELERDDTGGESIVTDEGTGGGGGEGWRERSARRKRESEKGIYGTKMEKILLSTHSSY